MTTMKKFGNGERNRFDHLRKRDALPHRDQAKSRSHGG